MTQAPSSTSLLGWLWKSLTSLRLTLVLLIILALISLVGTVRTQVFDTVWFLIPLGLFVLNLTACLIRGLPQAVRRSQQRLTPAAALELPERARFAWPPSLNPHSQVEKALNRELGPVHKSAGEDQVVYFWERGRFRPLGPYVVHLALLVILTGALLGKFLGVRGQLTLTEGENSQNFLSEEGKERPLDFQVRLDNFRVLYYPNGSPREFRSDLTFTGPSKTTEQAVCRVNDPVTFGSFTFYQASYGHTVRLEVKEGENSRIIEARVGEIVQLPGSQARFRVLEYRPNLLMPGGEKGQAEHLGPAARLAYWEGRGHPRIIILLKNRPELADKQPGPFRLFLQDANFFSVLQVKRDPGVWWVYAGFILLLPGLYLAFLRPAERWALVLRRNKPEGWDAQLLGAAPRAREAFQDRLERLQEILQKGGTA